MTYYGRWTYKYEEAAKRGAAGVLIVHETDPASYGWNTVKNSNTNTQFDIVRQNPAAAHTGFESWIQRRSPSRFSPRSGLNFDQAKAAAKMRNFQPIPLKATLTAQRPGAGRDDHFAQCRRLSAGQEISRRDGDLFGALGPSRHRQAGRPRRHHLQWRARQRDRHRPAARAGRAFVREPRTDRSVVFLAVTAEEKGLLGSEYYAQNPLFPAAKTAGVINTDGGQIWGPAKNFTISGNAKLDLLDMLVAEGKKQGRYYSPDPHPEAGAFLSFRPLLFRQGRRSGDQLRRRQ